MVELGVKMDEMGIWITWPSLSLATKMWVVSSNATVDSPEIRRRAGLGPGKGAEICHERRHHEYGLVDLLPLGSSWTALRPPAT